MIKYLISIILLSVVSNPVTAMRDNPEFAVTVQSDSIVADTIVAESDSLDLYLPILEDWDVVTLNGKLKMRGLPLSPSLKIFMEKDSLVEISIKAPIMGEVGRIVLTPDSVTGINKLNKTYTKESVGEFLKYYPGDISDFQNLLLGRVVFPGIGELREEIIESLIIEPTDEGLSLVPEEEFRIDGFDYGYITDIDMKPLVFLAFRTDDQNDSASINYYYDATRYYMDLNVHSNGFSLQPSLELNYPEWSGEPLKPLNTTRFTYLSLPEFIKNFGK